MNNTKLILLYTVGCILALYVLPAEGTGAEVIVTDRALQPDQIVVQAGERVDFESAMNVHGKHTLLITDEADNQVAAYPVTAEGWSHRFEQAGKYHILIREIPSIAGNAVVFSREGATADLRHEMVSYSIGYDLGQNVVRKLKNLNLELFNAGFEHAYSNQDPKLTPESMDFILNEYGREIARRSRDEREQIAVANLAASREFLAMNARQPDVVVLSSGLQYKILKRGSGEKPETGTRVRVHHKAVFLDGTEFDDTHEAPPAEFLLSDAVLSGYAEGLKMMSEGARWKLFIPPQLAYGVRGRPATASGAPIIAPNETLIFEVELLKVGD